MAHLNGSYNIEVSIPGLFGVRNASIAWEANYYSLLWFNENNAPKSIYSDEQRMTLINANESSISFETTERVEFGNSFWVNCTTNWTNDDYFMILSKDNQEFYRFNSKSEFEN